MKARFPLALPWALAMMAGLSACGGATQEESDQALKRAIDEPLDKARAVDAAVQKSAEEMRKQIDDAQGQPQADSP